MHTMIVTLCLVFSIMNINARDEKKPLKDPDISCPKKAFFKMLKKGNWNGAEEFLKRLNQGQRLTQSERKKAHAIIHTSSKRDSSLISTIGKALITGASAGALPIPFFWKYVEGGNDVAFYAYMAAAPTATIVALLILLPKYLETRFARENILHNIKSNLNDPITEDGDDPAEKMEEE